MNKDVYVDDCLRRHLLPFLREHHRDGNYVFWPDKASSHYSRKAIDFMRAEHINFVPYDRNPTNLPQCRPIEDLWGYLVDLVYEGGWRAETIEQLKRRVKASLKKVKIESVLASCASIRKKLRLVYREDAYAAAH